MTQGMVFVHVVQMTMLISKGCHVAYVSAILVYMYMYEESVYLEALHV